MGGFGSGNRYRFGTKDAVEEYCALDVRKLNREGMLDPGYRGSLAWRRGERKVSSIGLVAEHGRVVLKYRHRRGGLGDEWEDVEQPVYLTWTPCNLGGKRPWFVCPGGCERALLRPESSHLVQRRPLFLVPTLLRSHLPE